MVSDMLFERDAVQAAIAALDLGNSSCLAWEFPKNRDFIGVCRNI